MNLPNKLTVMRMVFAVPFIGLLLYYWGQMDADNKGGPIWALWIALALFVVAMITDFVDGYIARKQKIVTTFGKIMDPIADKIMTTSALIFLLVFGWTYVWIIFAFILRDIVVDGVRNLYASKNVKVAASIWGKLKTIVQSVGIIILFVTMIVRHQWPEAHMYTNYYIPVMNIPLGIGAALSVYSGLDYLIPLAKHLKLK